MYFVDDDNAAVLAMFVSSHCHKCSHQGVFLHHLSLVSFFKFLEFLPRAVLLNQHKLLMEKMSYLALEKEDVLVTCLGELSHTVPI